MIFRVRVLGLSGSSHFLGAHIVYKSIHIKETRAIVVFIKRESQNILCLQWKSLKNVDLKLYFKRCFSAVCVKLLCRYSVGMLPMCTEGRNVLEILA